MNLVRPVSPSTPSYVRVDCEAVGQRIDNFLIRHLKGVPRSHLYRVLRKGEVRVNRSRVKPEYRLQVGDEVRIPPLRRAEPTPAREPLPASMLERIAGQILFEDERLLIVDKPAGIAVHGGSGVHHGLIEALRRLRPNQELELAHRLDRETSGCLLVSKRRSMLRELHQLLRENAIEKRYIALLVGRMNQRQITVEAPLRKNVLRSGERLVQVDPVDGKPALTRFRRIEVRADATLVEARLVTGRTHQIRVHAAHLGLPIAGDDKYGDTRAEQWLRRRGLRRLFLHAASIAFRSTQTDASMRVDAPLPHELVTLLGAISTKP